MRVKMKNSQGEFEFECVEDARRFLEADEITDHDVFNMGYLASNLGCPAMQLILGKGRKAFAELRRRGMDEIVRELKGKA